VNGLVFDIKRYAIHDGPGIRTTVFLKGCPLRCEWCQNPEGRDPAPQISLLPGRCIRCGSCIEACPNVGAEAHSPAREVDPTRCIRCGACVDACPSGARALLGKTLSVPELIAEIEKDRLFYEQSGGGVTFSGGEPLMQAEFLLGCLKACRQREYHTAVDTCGYAPAETLLALAAYTDLFLYDLKVMDGARHEKSLGVSNTLILDNLRQLDARGCRVWIRVPLIPGLNDDDENLTAMADLVRTLNGPPPVHLLPYHRIGSDKYDRLGIPYPMKATGPLTDERVAQIAALLAARGLEVKTGG
jgi:pyruvate formate lyase activating enzyme